MSKIIYLPRSLLRNFFPNLNRRFVSTSKKNNETIKAEICKTEPQAEKNWVCYGYDYNSKQADRNAMHSITFASITLCMVVGGFAWMYMPDYNLRDWAQREAFLELRRREQAGLPLIDPNIIDPAKIALPSDEELGDTEIII
ncbi:hypothetical protein NQ317_003299 [Molorchus minor]|uniref:NADH dehydrogenase [ubiquinone] 1 beta subcomplex subunit 11, mitochondrial n=1 Tax=Molorchus minor TaxID=1323400 RepID=A0ABQ9J742_9CUCU|nr:hypothetical protein NQ317_003299 [Molorchus minor]